MYGRNAASIRARKCGVQSRKLDWVHFHACSTSRHLQSTDFCIPNAEERSEELQAGAPHSAREATLGRDAEEFHAFADAAFTTVGLCITPNTFLYTDPLNLGSDPADLKWYVQAELVHARFAMLGAAGILGQEVSTHQLAGDINFLIKFSCQQLRNQSRSILRDALARPKVHR
jgi:hypothetical protein